MRQRSKLLQAAALLLLGTVLLSLSGQTVAEASQVRVVYYDEPTPSGGEAELSVVVDGLTGKGILMYSQ